MSADQAAKLTKAERLRLARERSNANADAIRAKLEARDREEAENAAAVAAAEAALAEKRREYRRNSANKKARAQAAEPPKPESAAPDDAAPAPEESKRPPHIPNPTGETRVERRLRRADEREAREAQRAQPTQEELLRAQAPPLNVLLPNDAEGFTSFYSYMFADSGFGMPPHLYPVALALCDQRIKKLLVIIGPGSGKSLMISVAFPAFCLGQDPALTILGISAGEALMQGFMNAISAWIEFSPYWMTLFPKVRPSKDLGWSTDRGLFVTGHNAGDPDASYFACGLTSKALTGKHARLINCDDLHDRENSSSAEACLRVRETYYRQILGRADPRGARYVFSGRRWHEEDLYGHFKQTGEWVVMELPALRDKSHALYWDITLPEGLVCCFNEEKDAPKQTLEESRVQLVDPLGRPL